MCAHPAHLGEFRIEAILGQGGSGVVYAADWGPRRVALKVLHPTLVGTDKERAQFLAEARKLQQIAHPAVVKVFSVGELPDARPYLAMERLEGETLASVIARGAIALAPALALFAELCGAVGALHAQGLVHRDLKPENVFVVAGKHAVLLDFGIAKDLAAPPSTTTQDGHVRGTPAYMAPERFFGQPAGIATDIYELALVLYVMLAGRLPWDQLEDPEARLAPRSLCELAPVPVALDVEIRRALSTRAANRPASAEALLAAVRAASDGVGAAEIGPGETAQLRPTRDGARADGDAGPGEQPTPLAWAPRADGARERKGRRWTWWAAAGGIAVLGAVVGFAINARTSTTSAGASAPGSSANAGSGATTGTVTSTSTVAAVKADPNDPWAGQAAAAEIVKAMPLVEPELTPETYRAEAAAAIARLPSDTRFVFAAQVGELRAQPQIADMLAKAGKQPQVAFMAGMLPPCLRAMVTDSEWVAFGAPSLHAPETGTVVLRGRWRRRDVESCLGDTTKPHVAHDGAKLFRISDDFWLDFIDEHTAFVTRHDELDAERVHDIVKHGAGPPAHTRELVAHMPADRAIAFVIDGKLGEDTLVSTLGVPRTSDLWGWVRVDKAGVSLDVAIDTKDAAAAKATAAKVRPQLDGLFGTSSKEAVGRLEVVEDKTVVHVRGNLTSLMLGLIGAAL